MPCQSEQYRFCQKFQFVRRSYNNESDNEQMEECFDFQKYATYVLAAPCCPLKDNIAITKESIIVERSDKRVQAYAFDNFPGE